MSKEAPWIALAIDWQDSEMLDGASHGERLAWVCLLCFAKAQGRAGRVRLRDMAFARKFDLSIEVVRSLLAKAKQAEAVIINGDVLTVVNWKRYQDPRNRCNSADDQMVTEQANGTQIIKTSGSVENDATTHPPPPTKPPPKKTIATGEAAGSHDAHFVEFWEAYPRRRRKNRKAAYDRWRTATRRAKPEVIIEAVKAYAMSQEGQGEFVKMPETWLNKECWNDDREAWFDGKPSDSQTYIEVDAAQFLEYFKMGKFKDKPTRHTTKINWVFGTLRDGTKVECRNYPAP